MKLRYLVLFSVAYTLVYLFLTLDVIGMEGRGPLIFAAALRPVGLPWLLLLVGIYFLRDVSLGRGRILFILLMLSHYLITGINLILYFSFREQGEVEALIRVMDLRPKTIYLTIAWYCGGQLLLWIMFFVALRDVRNSKLK